MLLTLAVLAVEWRKSYFNRKERNRNILTADSADNADFLPPASLEGAEITEPILCIL